MFYYLGCTFCISYLYAILYIHALMLNDIKKKKEKFFTLEETTVACIIRMIFQH